MKSIQFIDMMEFRSKRQKLTEHPEDRNKRLLPQQVLEKGSTNLPITTFVRSSLYRRVWLVWCKRVIRRAGKGPTFCRNSHQRHTLPQTKSEALPRILRLVLETLPRFWGATFHTQILCTYSITFMLCQAHRKMKAFRGNVSIKTVKEVSSQADMEDHIQTGENLSFMSLPRKAITF